MTPAPGGRHCAACNKVVVDFSALSEADVLATLRQLGKVCGRFRPEQVVSDTAFPFSWARWLAAAAVSLSSCGTPDVTEVRLRTSTPAVQTDFVVRGQVTDKATGRPLSGVSIISQADSTVQVKTGADGKFALRLPNSLRDTTLVIVAANATNTSWVRYISRRIRPASNLAVALRQDETFMVAGEVAPLELEPGEIDPYLSPKLSAINLTPPACPLPEQPE